MLGACAAALALSCATAPGMPPSRANALLGRSAPTFNRRALDGRSVATHELRGRAVVVKFFAKYCVPCRASLPAAERAHRRLGDSVAFIGIAEDEYAADAQAMVTEYALSFPVIHDAGQVLWGRFRGDELPLTFVLDAAGVVRWIGASNGEDDLAQAIDATLTPEQAQGATGERP